MYTRSTFVNFVVSRVRYLNGTSAARYTLKELKVCFTALYSHDELCTCVNLNFIVSKFEQQCYLESVYAYKFIKIILGIASLTVNVDRCLK